MITSDVDESETDLRGGEQRASDAAMQAVTTLKDSVGMELAAQCSTER